MTSQSLDIIIAGGGICGLACAIALRRSGHTTRILERSQFTNEVGAAITLPPNATKVLQSWHLDFQAARMIPFNGVEFLAGESDTLSTIGEYSFSSFETNFGAPYLLSHRVDLHEALREMATSSKGPGKPTQIINGAHIINYDAEAGSVTLANGSVLSADLIVAADGVHSIASRFVGDHRPAVPSDTTVVRFLIPTSTLLEDPATADLVPRDGLASVYTAASRTHWLLRYPCRDNTLQNFGYYSTKNTTPRPTTATNTSTRTTLHTALSTFHPKIHSTVAKTASVLPLWTCLSRSPSPTTHRSRLVLAGDAWHAMLPHLGQGAAQSIEDAAALGILLSGIGIGKASEEKEEKESISEQISTRLNLFSQIRRDRVTAIQILSEVPGLDGDFANASAKWSQYLPGHEIPLQRSEVYAFCMSYDIIAECKRALLDRSSASSSS